MIDSMPDPMVDFEGYMLWYELHECPRCSGTGGTDDASHSEPCRLCDGTGICEPIDVYYYDE